MDHETSSKRHTERFTFLQPGCSLFSMRWRNVHANFDLVVGPIAGCTDVTLAFIAVSSCDKMGNVEISIKLRPHRKAVKGPLAAAEG